jgi:hypothetical protein
MVLEVLEQNFSKQIFSNKIFQTKFSQTKFFKLFFPQFSDWSCFLTCKVLLKEMRCKKLTSSLGNLSKIIVPSESHTINIIKKEGNSYPMSTHILA